jgi:site-specific DNA-adenine methylase
MKITKKGENIMTKSYQGGKGSMGVHQYIISKMPKHKVYIETHLGSGRILLQKKLAISSIAIDIDAKVIENFKRYSIDGLDDNNINLLNTDAFKFLTDYNFTGEELVYLDPTYPFDVRKSQVKMYEYEYSTQQHKELLHLLVNHVGLNCFVMISSYSNELYDNMLLENKYSNWCKFTFNAMTRSGIREEALYCNFNPDEHIKHDYSYIGKDYRERERIKRKGERWVKNLKALDVDERNYILALMIEEFDIAGHFKYPSKQIPIV